jgi:hypothetical protein
MFKKFFIKKMMQKHMANVPPEQQEKMLKVVEQNPELFQKMAAEIQAEMKTGKDQMAAAMSVAQKYQAELQEAMK